jgi:glycopeptide antibiotics resistance protein
MEKPAEKPKKLGSTRAVQVAAAVFLAAYIAVLFWQAFMFAYRSYERVPGAAAAYNLIPLKTIFYYLGSFNKLSPNVWFFNLFGNLLAFMPFGFLLFFSGRNRLSYKRITVLSSLLSLFIETVQLGLGVGIFDIDDVILNSIGGLLGYCCARFIGKGVFK